MPDLGPAELIIILLVCLLVFGGSRVAELGGSLGKGIKEFRSAMKEEDPKPASETPAATEAAAPAMGATAMAAADERTCARCGTVNAAHARFCSDCGNSLS